MWLNEKIVARNHSRMQVIKIVKQAYFRCSCLAFIIPGFSMFLAGNSHRDPSKFAISGEGLGELILEPMWRYATSATIGHLELVSHMNTPTLHVEYPSKISLLVACPWLTDPATGVSHGICTANDAMHCCKRCTGACLNEARHIDGPQEN